LKPAQSWLWRKQRGFLFADLFPIIEHGLQQGADGTRLYLAEVGPEGRGLASIPVGGRRPFAFVRFAAAGISVGEFALQSLWDSAAEIH